MTSLSKRRAKALSLSLFFLGLAILALIDQWWPGIMLVIGIPLALRQFLLGRYYDMLISLIIFIGSFVVAGFQVSWKVLLPALFIIGALWILGREFLEAKVHHVDEDIEDTAHEIEEND